MLNKFIEKNKDYFYFVFRILIGLLFLLHGIQKMPGILNGSTSVFGLIGMAGIIETVAGILIIIGLFVRYAAFITAIEMIVAYFKVHFPMGMNPLLNKGEPAVLFFVAFLVLIAFGARKWALDNLFKKR